MSARAAWRLEQLGFTQAFDYHLGRKDWEEAGLPVEGTDTRSQIIADALEHDPPISKISETVGEARLRLGDETQSIVVNETNVVVGVLRKESWDHPDDVLVDEAMRLGPATIRPGAALAPLVERMESKQVESIIVSDAEGRLIGVMSLDTAREVLEGKVERVYETCDSCPGWWRTRLIAS